MSHSFFGKRGASQRKLRFEQLENRELLSVSPLGMPVELGPPAAEIFFYRPPGEKTTAYGCIQTEMIEESITASLKHADNSKTTFDEREAGDISFSVAGNWSNARWLPLYCEFEITMEQVGESDWPLPSLQEMLQHYNNDSNIQVAMLDDQTAHVIYSSTWPGGFYFSLNNTNDAKPEADVKITVELLDLGAWCCERADGAFELHKLPHSGGAATFVINDDDHWNVSATTIDDEALEPCTWIPGNERTGAFEIKRADDSDMSYGVTVEFTLGGTATAFSAGLNPRDFHVTKSPNGGDSSAMATYDSAKGVWQTTIPAGLDSVTLYVMPDGDRIFEADETVTITLTDAWGSLNGMGHYNVDGSDGTVTILQAPEFISDTDKSQGITKDNILENDNGRKQTVNGDSYAAYVKRDAKKDDPVTIVTDIFAASNRGVQYRFAKTDSYGNVLRDTQGRPYMSISAGGADENLFVINSETGEITTNKTFKDEANLEATYRFTIIAFDPDETRLCDEARVTITLTQWNVARDGDVAADVVSSAGCTLAELADEIELNASEFKEWLYSKNEYVQLIDGTQIHKDNLSVTDILAANQQFEIPNTIVMAWFGEMGIAGQGWMLWLKNKSDLQALGFHVLVFNNDTYDDWLQPETMAAEAKGDFKHLLNNLSKSQFLHGLYMMGHGSPSSIGSSGTNVFTYGPEWSILYNSDRIGDNSDSIGGQIKYHLGAVIIHACHSNDFGNTAASLKSGKGLFVGQEGVYVPIIGVERIATHWGEVLADIGEGDLYYLYGGRQRTDQIIGSEF